MEDLDPSAVTDRDHAAVRATGQVCVGFDIEHDRAVVTGGHIEDVDALDTEQFIGPRTPPRRRRRHAGARRVHQRQGPSGATAWSPLIVRALTPFHRPDTPLEASTSTTLIWEGP
ncbi:hypothetical protein, partial [Nocardioides glacieisoli]|uniref:hypothetical protein n=1 Tax=Nocardioides glacieisoli TaxID=1168730 RepID=UPI001A90D5B5